ncbi:unnamed protein product [Penicillium olsonii]|uniref:Ubiquitin interaction motif protein n=1 Tax=Penicillium olsonii TaxID=99116 RepID=A0A9W4HM63_PENOL|nr:unnamed protein product [Penicillium olsonii]
MEPTEDAIDNFVSFTSTSRDRAILFLKATGYFSDPGLPWDFSQQDNAPPLPATAPPSRPPSRIDKRTTEQNTGTQGADAGTSTEGSGKGLSLAEREEKELQRAVAMSLGSDMGQQETGVTSSGQSQLSKATRDHYEENAWAMTLFNSEEVTTSPDPEDRIRMEGEPAFIRPNAEEVYLGGFLTILHNIPLAREALLLRQKLLFDYGHEPQWWNGQSINLPKIVTVSDGQEIDNDWDDIIHETQRLMSFMDSTKRGFGSSDSLAKLKSMSPMSTDSEDAVTRFMEAWHGAAIQANPDNPLSTIFTSHAYKKSVFGDYDPEDKELFTFEPSVEKEHGQTLYEVLDTALWTDTPGQELDDTWLEHVAEVVVFKLDAFQKPNPVDVEIPSVFYPDRYLSSCRDIAREFRSKRLEIQTEIGKLDALTKKYTYPEGCINRFTAQEIFVKTADGLEADAGCVIGSGPAIEAKIAEKIRISKELRIVAERVGLKLQELEQKRQSALESLREISKTLTEPSESPSEPPIYKYTLRGVCTQPHVTYVLSDPHATAGDLMDMDSEPHDNYEWWRISYSAEDGKARQAEKRQSQSTEPSQSSDAVGYTIRKVSEAEVLRAAREEWSSVLLVYASSNAMNAQVDPAPPQLQVRYILRVPSWYWQAPTDRIQGFVNRDNDALSAELEQTPAIVISDQEQPWSANWPDVEQQQKQQGPEKPAQVNVFDYEVSNFEGEPNPSQEMEQKGGAGLWASGTSHPVEKPQDEIQLMDVDTPDDNDNAHVEHA